MPQVVENRPILFEVIPAGGAYDRPVVLYRDTWENHIQPYKANVTIAAIQQVVTTPSRIYLDKTQETRQVLINDSIVTESGTKMTVFVETQTVTRYVHVATAFYNRNPNVGPLLFDFSSVQTGSTLRSSYDEANDILYLGVDDTKSAEDEEIEDGVYLGYPEGAERPGAAMVFGVRKRGPDQRGHVIEILANALRIKREQVRDAFEKAS
jgi:hypothetical protein